MNPYIRIFPSKKLFGKHTTVTMASDDPTALWRPFKMKLKELGINNTECFYSIQVYDGVDFSQFTPSTEFEKWAAIELDNRQKPPRDMETFELVGGKYAVFIHKGTSVTLHKTTDFIFGEWLPNSGFSLDNRPHLAIMTSNYRPDDPNAEELICIPLK